MKLSANHLLLTARGTAWLNSFDEPDRPLVRELTGALSLVSLTEFERSLANLILDVASRSGTVALYSAREVGIGGLSFEEDSGNSESGLDATPRGADIGSEGRTAHIARQICRNAPEKFVLQPSISQLRERRVERIIVIDDLLGSGSRCTSYLQALWKYATVKSWWSYKLIKFSVVAYAATEDAEKFVRRHHSLPSVHVHRYCPTISSLSWPPRRRTAARALCNKYGKRWKLRFPSLGYKKTASLLVFEHGCPNNVPAIFWAEAERGPDAWHPVFEGRSTSGSVASAFPHEFEADTPVNVLVAAGQRQLAASLPAAADRPLSANTLVVLSLLWKGRRRMETLADATGLTAKECGELLEACIRSGYATPLRRITDVGLAEIRGALAAKTLRQNPVAGPGQDLYYPRALRDRTSG